MSDPGYPQTRSVMAYERAILKDQFGNVYNSEDYHSIRNYRRDKGGTDTPGWPHFKQNNPYWAFEVYANDLQIHFSGERQDSPNPWRLSKETSLLYAATGSGIDELLDRYVWPHVAECRGDARERAVNKMADNTQSSKVNLLQAYAEREQVANLVASTARRITDSILALRRRDFNHAIYSLTGSRPERGLTRGIKRRFGGLPEQWLALQYGWKPLLSDVYGSCEELARTLVGRNCDLYEAIGTGGGGLSGVDLVHTGDDLPDFEYFWDLRSHARACCTFQVLSEGASFLERTGITNPLLLGWELLPYSFVVDWFLPVGNFLQNMNYSNGLGFNRGYVSSKVEGSFGVRCTNNGKLPNLFTSGGWSGGTLSGTFRSFERGVYYSWPAISPPRFKDPFSPTHVANALSLLASAFGSGRTVR